MQIRAARPPPVAAAAARASLIQSAELSYES